VKDILQDNKIVLPKLENGSLALGFIGSCAIGGVVGYFVDGNPLTAFTAGFTGYAALEALIKGKGTTIPEIKKSNEQIIRETAMLYGIDADLAVRVAQCESKLNEKVKNINAGGSCDRGLFQINNKWHPEVTDEQALDPEFSARFFCEAVKNNHLDWWSATKSCWNK
jgi:hypothetical protein